VGDADELARALGAREVDVAELVRRAEADARADVAETLRRLFADDLLRRALAHLSDRRVVALVGIGEGVTPIVREVDESALQDEARLESELRTHNAMLLEGLENGTVIPFRFGVVFPDRAAVGDWVARHRDELALELERLRGKAEWAVEVVMRPPEGEPGRYLEERLATAVRPDARKRLAALAEDVSGNAYLVATRDRPDFDAALADLEREGYELRVTGPWPAYSFARLP
jgi:Gas vesicle synthesis protein GvpL/GvpF